MKKSKLFVLPLMAILLLAGCDDKTSSSTSSSSNSQTPSSLVSSSSSSTSSSAISPSSSSSSLSSSESTSSSVSSSSSTSSSSAYSSSSSSTSTSSSSISSEDEQGKHTFNIKIQENAVYGLSKDSFLFDKTSYKTGDSVNYTILNMASSISSFNYALINIGGHNIAFNVEASGNDVVGSFTMPEVGEEKEVDFIIGQYSVYTNTEASDSKNISFDLGDGIVAIAPETIKTGSRISGFSLYRSKDIVISKISYKLGEGEYISVDSSLIWKNNFASIDLSLEVYDNLTIKIETKVAQKRNLNIVGGEYVNFTSTPSATYLEGETVDLSYNAVDGYNVTYTIEGATNTRGGTSICFNMPTNDVTITFVPTSFPSIIIENNENIESTTIYAKPNSTAGYYIETNKANNYSSFYVIPKVKEGYKVTSAYIKGDETNKVTPYEQTFSATSSHASMKLYGFNFYMPSNATESITIVINTVKLGKISYTEDSTYFNKVNIIDNNGNTSTLDNIGIGETFKIQPSVISGYQLVSALVSDGSDSNLSYSKYDNNGYYIEATMPNSGICKFTFTFEKTYEITLENTNDVYFSCENNNTKHVKDDTVKVGISVINSSKVLKSVKYNDGENDVELEIKTNEYNQKYVEFNMPEKNITISATLEDAPKASIKFEVNNYSSYDIDSVSIQNMNSYIFSQGISKQDYKETTAEIEEGGVIIISIGDTNTTQRFDVKVTVIYKDKSYKEINANYVHGNYSIENIKVTSDIAIIEIAVYDHAA